MAVENSSVLTVQDLKVVFSTKKGEVHAVNTISFDLKPGELLGVVGESGSGKSVTMMSILGLLPSPPAEIKSGTVLFAGKELLKSDPKEIRQIRGGEIGFIFQDPMTSLNPVFSIGFQIMEPLKKHMGYSRRKAKKRAIELLDLVGIPDPSKRINDYPHQFSGGMRQRVMIAISLACDPKLLIADEPTTALDVTIQAQIIELIKDLRKKLGMSIIWITHDLGVIAGIATRVIVMYAGQIVEQANVEELFANPQHPYTKALIGTIPAVRGERAKRLNSIRGQAPTTLQTPDLCSFHPRCDFAFGKCTAMNPQLIEHRKNHFVACHMLENMRQTVG